MCFRRLLQTSTYRYSFKICAENRIWTGIIGTVITALLDFRPEVNKPRKGIFNLSNFFFADLPSQKLDRLTFVVSFYLLLLC